MNKEFIPYEQALALKELGFDEPCFMFYEQGTKNKYLQQGVDDDYWGDYSEPRDWNSIPNKPWKPFCQCISAPLYQQAFRWFREKHDLDYSLLPESSSGHRLSTRTFNIVIYKYHMNMNVQSEIVRIDGKIVRYNKREEAELACLKHLIKTVKEQKGNDE